MATDERTEEQGEQHSQGEGDGKIGLDRSDESQDFVDQSKIDFDPDDGLYSGTAVDGTSEIAGPHLSSESGELSPEDMQEEARKEAEEAGVDPEDTPANKSPVARAAEQSEGESGSPTDESGDRRDG
jgi:hypothetical protein